MSFPNPPQDQNPFGAVPQPPAAAVPPAAPSYSAAPVPPVAPAAPGVPVPPVTGSIPPPFTAAAPPVPGAYSPTVAAAAKTNVLAICSLVAAFVLSPLAIVLGVIAKKQIRERGEGGKGLATAGLILGILGTVGGVIALVFSLAVAGAVVSASDDIAKAAATVAPVVPNPTGVANSPVEQAMHADVQAMVRMQESYRAAHPGTPGVEASTILGPVKVGSATFTPTAENVVTVGLAPVSKDLPAGGYCVMVINEQASEPLMYDSALGQVISEDVAAGALKGACINVAVK